MGEYILYVILIFIPIGGLMVYLLRKDGLPGKYINIILVLSLLIILSFPISMERLGRSVSLMIYVLLLAALAGYLLRARVGSLALFMVPEIAADNQHNGINTALIGPAASAMELVEDGDNYPEPIQEEMSEESSIRDEIESNEAGEPAADLKEDNEHLLDEALEPITAKKPDYVPQVVNEPEVVIEPPKMAQEAAQEAGIEVLEVQSLPEPPAWDNQSVDKETEETVVTGANLLFEQPDSSGDGGDPEVPEPTDTVAGIDISGQDREADYQPELVEPTPAVLDSGSSDAIESVSSVLSNGEAAESSAPENLVINLIDTAFACRATDQVEAARYFEEAWNLTFDYELKYLLTVELVEIYKDNGWYKKAVSMLDSFIALPNHKSDIINEISRQFDYISLLAAELNRLGISDLPVSRIPRWVRLKVDAEMNPREYR